MTLQQNEKRNTEIHRVVSVLPIERAIYVGKPSAFLRYGMTGRNYPDYFGPVFYPDGLGGAFCLDRKDLYIPSEDQTRFCPKP